MKLKLADNLSLPVDVVTQTIAMLAKRRAGKSYTMRRIAEQLLKASQQVVIVDPKGDQWGIRYGADGKSPGLPVIILGGERGDIDLEVSGGEIVAKLVVEERVSALLDLSLFRKREVATFMAEFLENVYRLKAREQFRTPMMLVVDEADAIAPQKPQPGEERMLGAIEDIVRRGGQRGIGCTLVTQRSAVLNKNVLTQAQILVALRTIAPQDLKAMKEWIDVHGEEHEREMLMDSLPSLPVGDAWFWSPGWPSADGIFARVRVLPIETFDSGATPKPGEKRAEPKNIADVDLEALKRQMSETIERKKANDPKELKAQIAALKKELAAKVSIAPATEKVAREQKSVLTDADRKLLWELIEALRYSVSQLVIRDNGVMQKLGPRLEQLVLNAIKAEAAEAAKARGEFEKRLESKGLQKILTKLEGVAIVAPGPGRTAATPARVTPPAGVSKAAHNMRAKSHTQAVQTDGPLPPGELATLTAALQYEGLDRKRLSVLTGYKRSSRDAYIARLSAKGLIDVRGQQLYQTTAGREALNGNFEPLPTGRDLIAYWRDRLPEGERATLDVLIEAEGEEVARDVIDETTGYKRSSRDAYLTRLKARGLVEFAGRGTVRASAELFQ